MTGIVATRTGRAHAFAAKLMLAGALGFMPFVSAAPQTGQAGTDQQKEKEASAQSQKLAITFKSQPSPPVTGDNKFEVTVKDAMGTPIADADVSLGFHMDAMPAMKMPEMKNEVKLKSEGGGTYRGTGNVLMAGKWDVTVHVKQGGKEIGKKLFPVTAK